MEEYPLDVIDLPNINSCMYTHAQADKYTWIIPLIFSKDQAERFLSNLSHLTISVRGVISENLSSIVLPTTKFYDYFTFFNNFRNFQNISFLLFLEAHQCNALEIMFL